MKLKKTLIITLLLLCLLMIGAVSATSDTNDTLSSSDTINKSDTHIDDNKKISDKISATYTDIEEETSKIISKNEINEDKEKLSSTPKKNVKGVGGTKSFTDLKESISGNISADNYEISLDSDYKYSESDDFPEGIVIRGTTPANPTDEIIIGTSKTLNIKGNGNTIDANGQARLFIVTAFAKLKLENLTIINCKAVGGGAIQDDNSAIITIINCTLENNTATDTQGFGGGSIFISYATLEIIDSKLENNNATSNGGAIYVEDDSTVTIINSTLKNNNAYYGGAIHTYDSTVTIINSTVKNNNAYYGGAISDVRSTLIVTNNTLDNNNATKYSAIYKLQGTSDIQYNTFSDNTDNDDSVNIYVDRTINKFLTTPLFKIEDIPDFVKGNSITINVSVIDITDELNVNVTIGTEIYPITVINGHGEDTVTPDLSPGTYKAILNFIETGRYRSTSTTSNEFHVKIANPNIKIENIPNFEVGQEITITVTADKSFSNTLNITINGTNYPIDINNGEGFIKITPNLKPGEYNATITYSEIDPTITVTSNKFRVRNITELLDTIKQLKEQISELIKANKTLNKNITDLQTTITELENRITELEKLKTNITRLEAEINELIKANKTLNKNITDLQATITELENRITELEKLKTNITRLEAEISELKLNNTKLLEKIYILNNTIQDQNVTKLQNEINELKNYFKAQIDELIENNTKLAEKINTQNDMINQLNITIQNQNITPLKLPIEIVGNINVTPSSYTEIINKLDQILKNTPTTPTNQPNVSQEKVTKKATKITAKKKTFKRKVKIKKYKATLKSGKKRVAKVYLYITIKGKKYKKTFKAKTNKKGIATFKIKKLTTKGKYTATIKYKGNKTYKKSTKKVKITIK